jgi:ferritin-like metal-binding protein YciE
MRSFFGATKPRGNSERSSKLKHQIRENMKLDTLKKLYVEELRDIYSAEQQLVKTLPKMAKGASSDELREAIETHLDETKGHVERLEQIFEELGESPKGKTCQAMKGLVEEGSEILEEKGEDSVLDAGIIAAAQKVEHYEIATYGTLRTWADLLNQEEAAGLLQETLDEEGEADKKLNELAEEIVNPEALLQGDEEAAVGSGRQR